RQGPRRAEPSQESRDPRLARFGRRAPSRSRGQGVVESVRFRKYALLLGVLLTSLFLLTVQTRGGGQTRAGDVLAFALNPLQSALAKIHRGALGTWHVFTDWRAGRPEDTAPRAPHQPP